MSNLLEKASIVTTPTAYENGKILSVKPAPSLGSELMPSTATIANLGGGSITQITENFYSSTSDGTSGSAVRPKFDFNTTSGKIYKLVITPIGTITGTINFDFYDGSTYLFQDYDFTTIKEITFTDNGTVFGAFNGQLAYSISNFKVSVKEAIDGDFDFTRNSSATRVNSQGLIEDVQILSSNLVTNGDFSQVGSEQITNGDFSNGSTDWANPDNAATFSNDSVTLSGGSGNRRILQSNVTSPTSSQWKLQYEIIEKVGTSDLRTYTTSGYSIIPSTVGVHTYYFNSNLTSFYFAFSNSTGSITIDNVSVKEVGQDWTLGAGWSIGTNKAIATDAVFGAVIADNTTLVANKKYKVSFNVSDYVKGNVRVTVGNSFSSDVSADGSYTFILTSANTNAFKAQTRAGGSGTTLSITNFSVVEITDDTNLPRIDYTGGVGHWLFEPQSTNLIITSDSGVYGSSPASEILTTAPDGTNTSVRPVPSTGSNRYTGRISGGTYATNTKITYSWYRKRISTPVVDIYVGDLIPQILVNVTQVGSTIEIKSNINGFDKFSATFNISDGSLDSNIRLYFGEIIGNGNSSIAYWGHQLEVGSFATSIIPTSGAISTRLQDAAFGAGSSDLINSTEGVLYAEIAAFISTDATEPNRYLTLTNGTSNQRIALLFGGNNNQLRAIAYSNTQSINLSFSTSLTDTKQFNKLAIKYKSGDYAFFLNGIKIGGSTEANIFTADTLNDLSFNVGGGTQKFRGKVKCVAVWKEALTDAELTCLTTI